MPTTDSKQEPSYNPKQTFLRYLPERIEAIEEDWRALVNRGWSSAKLARLLQRCRELVSIASQYELARLNEGILPLIQSFQDLLEIKRHPSTQQLEQVSNLLQRFIMLQQDGERLNNSINVDGGCPPVVYLCNNETLAPAINTALSSLHYPLVRVRTPTELLQQLEKTTLSALVVDAKMLPQLALPLAEISQNIKQAGKTMPALVVLSTNGSLDIRLQSLRAGAGAFFVTPINAQAVAERIQQLVNPPLEPPYRILVMDDDKSQAEFAVAIIRKQGLESRAVTDPEQLLDVMAEFGPDLVLMDLYMPGVDGLELTQIIREQTNFLSLPIVFMSGEQDADKQLDALSVGGDDFINKPVRPRRLVTLIKNRIQRARAGRRQTKDSIHRDPMTGLPNRSFLFERIDQILTNGAQDLAYGLLYLEIDGMEAIRENIGNGLAEVFLTGLSTRLLTVIDPRDTCARVDDNRLAVLSIRPQESDLIKLGEDLIQAVAQRGFSVNGLNTQPTLSVGLCRFYPAPSNSAKLEQNAIIACAKAVSEGGNRLVADINIQIQAPKLKPTPAVVPTPAPEPISASVPAPTTKSRSALIEPVYPKSMEVFDTLRQALRNNQFQMQPQKFVNLRNPQYELQEMQWRWINPEGKAISASEILSIAKQSPGLNRDIDRWLVGKSLDVLRENRQTGCQIGLLVHQTLETITDQQTSSWLKEELRRRLLVGTGLIIKFNLADIAAAHKTVSNLMGEFAVMGVEICIGRFGNNEASQKILKYLKTPYIKISDKLLTADTATITLLLDQASESNSKIILSRIHDPRTITKAWLTKADFIQNNAV